ncbi:hypothetical protein EAX61_06895 [Dokdonia sinensis]|jgi:Zn-dependent peptidase ImmA (M78 family)|uniref:HTH cro/C1-type domain-containing protein n=1 Tax=Dokdonia sinensis TaxID=2479847 RepID=A0A3M0GG08_9FLAO|nr:hypothetical protein [Dokdonia sinensis]RMB60543.1 hypothetical protein EAX61_06895 [Dokdonia sinensis]
MSKKHSDIDDILRKVFEPKPTQIKENLEELFENRIDSLSITKTTALKMMGMTVRTLDGILTGQQKMLDYTQLIKLSNFLGVELEETTVLYVKKLQEVHNPEEDLEKMSQKVKFVNEKFNLAEMRKVGLIKSLSDYDDIIERLCNYFGLTNILDYREPDINVAFSSGKRAKRNCAIMNWMYLAEKTCIELRNTNEFDQEKLVSYFPEIRWQSMDVDNGLVNVIQQLYQLGVTVVFIPSFPSLHIRGATFEVNNKPCIALTDYVGFYPTLWFALVHELYHVLFDWDEIRLSSYHISQEQQKSLDSHSANEVEADAFAREYFFSTSKTNEVRGLIKNDNYIREFALSNNVHPSFIYTFYAWDTPDADKYSWARAKKFNPDTTRLLRKIDFPFGNNMSYSEHIKNLRRTIYN